MEKFAVKEKIEFGLWERGQLSEVAQSMQSFEYLQKKN
jgi:hypothetical protein